MVVGPELQRARHAGRRAPLEGAHPYRCLAHGWNRRLISFGFHLDESYPRPGFDRKGTHWMRERDVPMSPQEATSRRRKPTTASASSTTTVVTDTATPSQA